MNGMEMCALSSGSHGNAIYLTGGKTSLLVDNGLTGKELTARMAHLQLTPQRLNGMLITHEHGDHIRGVGILSRKYNIPIYANSHTWEAMEHAIGTIACENIHIIEADEEFRIGDIDVLPFSTPHDAADPMGYTFSSNDCRVGIATDLGHTNSSILDRLAGVDLLLLESNHDVEMLRVGPYPKMLKQRVGGKNGHLSNDDCAKAVLALLDSGVRQVLLGHLSEENNTPELAQRTVCAFLAKKGVDVGEDVQVHLTYRHHISGLYQISSSD